MALPSINGIRLVMILVDNGRVEPSERISSEATHASAVTDGLDPVLIPKIPLRHIEAHLEGREKPLRRDG